MSELLMVAAVCLVTAAMTLIWLLPKQTNQKRALPQLRNDPVFLFDGNELMGMSISPSEAVGGISDWGGLKRHLADRYPTFPDSPDVIKEKGQILIPPVHSGAQTDVHCEWIDGITRVQLRQKECSEANLTSTDPVRAATDNAPYPVWCLDSSGAICWYNEAYAKVLHKIRGQGSADHSPLFDIPSALSSKGNKSRISVTHDTSQQKLWFDLTVVEQGESRLCFATDINAVVDAEIAQRNFVQTLAKTFAQLSIGLAIFDRNRQLALFNPALIDLTALPADFLSGRPSIMNFFDRLRNQTMMPEPKNYRSWRQQMNDLVEAAADGRYQETWTLPSGSVYSVSGRPHPDGAVAFLFEDITAEITLTRRFRSELELGQSILDQLSEAIAVFSSDGAMSFSNVAYRRLWDVDPEASFAMVTILDATRVWQDNCTATPAWGEIRDFVSNREHRSEWNETVQMRSGPDLKCVISPILNGGTMIRFSVVHSNKQADEMIDAHD